MSAELKPELKPELKQSNKYTPAHNRATCERGGCPSPSCKECRAAEQPVEAEVVEYQEPIDR